MEEEHGFESLHLTLARLPPGRHGLPREFVVRNQRARLVLAMAQVTVEHGYGGATVARIAATAAVSRRTFFEHFESKRDCFVAVYELAVAQVVEAAAAAMVDLEEPRARLEAGLAAALGILAGEPELARICMVESLAAKLGRGGEEAFAEILGASRNCEGPRRREQAAAGGIAAAVRERVRRGESKELPGLVRDTAELAARLLGM